MCGSIAFVFDAVNQTKHTKTQEVKCTTEFNKTDAIEEFG